MKKNVKFAAFLLVFALLFVLCACGNNKDTFGNDPSVHLLKGLSIRQKPVEPQTPLNTILRETVADNNFMSRSTVSYPNINDKNVTVDLFYRFNDEVRNNPNVGVGIMLYQCIKYKQQHPEKEVYISFTSFHVSIVAGVCLKKDSPDYGKMKSVYFGEYDDEGYVRISYLLVYAAKIGINTLVIGQIDASPVYYVDRYVPDLSFDKYFNDHLGDQSEIAGKTVADFMTFRKAHWTSYGDKSASDMMHNKTCTVSNYIDDDGAEHGSATWFGSTNLDGIHSNGANGNNGIQTGVIVGDHEEIRNVTYNYTRFVSRYCEQEEIAEFRNFISNTNKKQIDLILSGRENEINSDEQIVYLGGEKDGVFELYFTPFGGSVGKWDVKYNVFSKYIGKLLPSVSGEDSIVFAWNNVKYLTNFEYSKTLSNILLTAFTENDNTKNKLYLSLPGMDYSMYDSLAVGQNIGEKRLGEHRENHAKDLQLSYTEDGTRFYVTMFSSLNFHQGSMWYQTNTILVIKETNETGNDVYTTFGKRATWGLIGESDRIVK